VFAFAVLRWVLARTLRQPLAWIALAALASLWPLWLVLQPDRLLITRPTEAAQLSYEVAFVGSLLGSCFALVALARGRAVLAELGAGRRRLAEFLALLATALLFQAVCLLPALGRAGETAPSLDRLPALLLCDLHLAALALVLARLRLPAASLPILLLALAWILPALVPWAGPAGLAVQRVLDPAGLLRGEWGAAAPGRLPLVDMMPAAALLLAACLLPSPPAQR